MLPISKSELDSINHLLYPLDNLGLGVREGAETLGKLRIIVQFYSE